jgi:hypothetical protein
MKTLLSALLAGLILAAAPAFGAAAAPKTPAAPRTQAPRTETIDLQTMGRIVLTLPTGWTVVREDPSLPLDLTLKAPAGVNASLRLTLGLPAEGLYESAREIRAKATELGEMAAEESVEKQTVLQTFSLRQGYGYYSSYTDPKLVGKKPVPEDYKNITVGMIRPAPGIVGVITLLCDDLAGPEHRQLMQVIETLELIGPGGNRRRAEI